LPEIAEVFAALMTDVIGYKRFGTQGGDWGAFVASRLGFAYPDRMIGIHLNLFAVRRDSNMVDNPTPEEKVFLDQLKLFLKSTTLKSRTGTNFLKVFPVLFY
jgi:pimeloyl-ACP methyl ester carboxylesterase